MAMLWHQPYGYDRAPLDALTDRRVDAALHEREGMGASLVAIGATGGATFLGSVCYAYATHEPRPAPAECAGTFSELVRQRLGCDAVDTSAAMEAGAGIGAALLAGVALVYARRAGRALR